MTTTATTNNTRVKLKGKSMWAKVHQPDTAYEHKWTIDLLLDEESLKIAKDLGLRVKTNDKYKNLYKGYEDGHFLRIDKPVMNSKGERNDPPAVKDSKLRDVGSHIQIGNGSDVYVQMFVKNQDEKTVKKWGGKGVYLLGVQILTLVPVQRKVNEDIDFVDEGSGFDASGFVMATPSPDSADIDATVFDKAS